MRTLILTSSTLHLKPYLEKYGEFNLLVSEPNKDGKLLFPDGEVYVRFPSVSKIKGRIVVLHAGVPHPNRGLVELESTLSVLRQGGHTNIEVFFTYMPYSMQDKVHKDGETNAAQNLLQKLVSYHGVKRIYAIDPHFGDAVWVTAFPFVAVSAHELLLSGALKHYQGAVFVAPDKGHEIRTQKLKGPEKSRQDSHTVTLKHDEAFMNELRGKTIGVVDDIIETGGTLMKFHEACASYLPKELFVVATHGVLPEGITRVKKTYSRLFLSNTIPHAEASIDVTSLIVSTLKRHEI